MGKFTFVLALALSIFSANHAYAAGGFAGEPFQSVFYYTYGGAGSESGLDAGNAKDFADGDVMAIAAKTLIKKVYVIVDTEIVGLADKAIEVGDDDSADGYVDHANYVSMLAAGLYGYDAGKAGSYRRVSGLSGSDVYITEGGKYYSASGKEIKLDVTGSASAGAFRVVVEGFRFK